MRSEEKLTNEARGKVLMEELEPMSAYIEALKAKHGNPPVGLTEKERDLMDQYRVKMRPLLEELAQVSDVLMNAQPLKDMG